MKSKDDILKLLSLMLDLQIKRVKSTQETGDFRVKDTSQRVKEDKHIRKIFRELGLPPDNLLKELKDLARVCVENESGQEALSQESYIKNLLRDKFKILKFLPIIEVQGQETSGLLRIRSIETKKEYESVYIKTDKTDGWVCSEIAPRKSFKLFELVDQIMNFDFSKQKATK